MKSLLQIGLCVGLLVAGAFVPATSGVSPVYAEGFVDEKVDSALAAELDRVAADAPLEVVIVYSDLSAADRVRGMASRYFQMQALPMAGAVLTAAQIEDLATWPEVYSLTLNAPLQYFLHESVATIRADAVWSTYGQTGGNATVAVIDGGIDATHTDLLLGAKVIQNVKVLPFEVALEDQPVTDTTSGHGTHVAGIIGGNGMASDGYYKGVAPDVKLVGLGAGEVIFILTATQAYDWVLQHHAEYNIRVINNSWGSTGGNINVRNPIAVASFEAYKKGLVSIFAAGNDGGYDVMNPYSLPPWLLSVAAGDKDGATLADFSSRGKDGDYFKHPDVTAPGVDIYAARSKTIGVTGTDPFPNPVNPEWTLTYTVLSGTSMATPHVAGAAGLLFSSNPKLSPDQVMDLIVSSTRPMSGTLRHEAGNGYMDALAAYEASRSVTGNLDSFLAGGYQHSPEEVLGFDHNVPGPSEEIVFTGLVPAGAGGVITIDHPFEVGSDVKYVEITVTWTPQAEDALDMEVHDPQGRVVISSGNGLNEPELALFVPESPGTYTLHLITFAAVAAQYEARVELFTGQPPANWPPTTPPGYDTYIGVAGVFKTYGVVGILSDYFRAGDQGFVVFNLARADGTPLAGQAANLQVVYTDRTGNVAFTSSSISDRGGGEYSSSFNTGSTNWKGGPGLVTASFVWKGSGSLRALPAFFYLNNLATTLQTDAANYEPGDTIAFSGDVSQINNVATGDVENTPLGSANVTITLLDSAGNSLTSTTAQTDLQGHYGGTLAAPANASGQTRLVAEARFQDPTIVLGPKDWYGRAQAKLTFPGNEPPTLSLSATPVSGAKKFTIHIDARVSDPDGAADVVTVTLVLKDKGGNTRAKWSRSNFTQADANTLTFVKDQPMSGKSPWMLTLTATDSEGHTATKSVTITK